MPDHECCNEALKVDISYIKEGMDEMKETFKSFESKFAGKWVEKVLAWAGGIMGAAIILALMSLIIIPSKTVAWFQSFYNLIS